jgi:hypothetical protein
MRELPAVNPTDSAFEAFARLYAVSDPDVVTTFAHAGATWSAAIVGLNGQGPLIWGNLPMYGGGPAGAAVVYAMRRERALQEMRRRHATSIDGIHRLAPSIRGTRLRPMLRRALRGGLIVELGREGRPRVIDLIAGDAGLASQPPIRLRPRGDGSAFAMPHTLDGDHVVLRAVARAGHGPIDENADALEELERERVALTPRLVERGSAAGASWTIETVLPGRIAHELTPRLTRDVIEFAIGLPRRPASTALRDHLLALANLYPRWADLLVELAGTAVDGPGVLQHGDLWLRNLLVAGDRLTGVVDWETRHPAGIPGADLLQLVAMDRRASTGESIGALWVSRLWNTPRFEELVGPYWDALGIRTTQEQRDTMGLAWWAGQVLRQGRLASRVEWVAENVDRVLEAIGTAR